MFSVRDVTKPTPPNASETGRHNRRTFVASPRGSTTKKLLFADGVRQPAIVTEPLPGLSVFPPDMTSRAFSHFPYFRFTGARIVVLPARPKLADVLGPGIDHFLLDAAGIHPYVFVPVIVVVVEKILGNHVFLQ